MVREKSGNFNGFLYNLNVFANHSMEMINLSSTSTTFDFFHVEKSGNLSISGMKILEKSGKLTINVQWEPVC